MRLEHPDAHDKSIDVPELPGRSGYLKRTVDWWDEVCRSPQASRFTALDWQQLATIVAPLVEAFHREPSTKLAAELRQHMQLYGLSPKDRAALSWRVETPKSGPMARYGSYERKVPDRYAHLVTTEDGAVVDTSDDDEPMIPEEYAHLRPGTDGTGRYDHLKVVDPEIAPDPRHLLRNDDGA